MGCHGRSAPKLSEEEKPMMVRPPKQKPEAAEKPSSDSYRAKVAWNLGRGGRGQQ